MSNKTTYKYWAMKDTEKNKLVSNKFGRSLWIRKPNPSQTIFVGYTHCDRGTSMLKPVRVLVEEIDE